MPRKLGREEMIDIVRALQQGRGDDNQAAERTASLDLSARHPALTDLIFFPDEQMSAEEVVDRALAYRPTDL